MHNMSCNHVNTDPGAYAFNVQQAKISNEGSSEDGSCVSPQANFFTSIWRCSFLCIPFAFEYVIHARFHRVAFLRTERVTKNIITQTRKVMPSLFRYAIRSRAERKRDRENRLLKTWLFLLWALITIVIVTLLSFVSQMSGVLFYSMILWKNLASSITDTFSAILEASLEAVGNLLQFAPIYYLFYSIMVVFDFFANFTINFDAIEVTCQGAQAPLELFINLVIMGLAIVIVESDVQIYRAITFNSMTDKFIECYTQPAYRLWASRGRGEHRHSTVRGMWNYILTGFSAVCIRAFGGFDIVQSFLQYIMSLVTIDLFFLFMHTQTTVMKYQISKNLMKL